MSYHNEQTGEFVSGETHPVQALAEDQLQWLEQTLSESTADYLWVSGHYPVYSHCEHGPTAAIILSVLPMLKKHGVTGYIAGHDHCSAYYYNDAIAFPVAGAGKECCYSPKNLDNKVNPGEPLFRMDSGQNHSQIGGFASYSVTAEATTVRFHGADGSVLYAADPLPPRKQKKTKATKHDNDNNDEKDDDDTHRSVAGDDDHHPPDSDQLGICHIEQDCTTSADCSPDCPRCPAGGGVCCSPMWPTCQ